VPSLTIGEILNEGIPQVFLASTLEFPQHILAKGVVCTHVILGCGVDFPTLIPSGAWLANILAQRATAQVVTEIR